MYVLGDVAPALQKVYDQLQVLPYEYASAFPHVDFAKYDATIGGSPATIGDLVHSGEISPAEYEAVFGPLPSIDDPNIAKQYQAMVDDTKRGIASGQYSPSSLDALTPEFYLAHYTPFGSSVAARAGGYTIDTGGDTVFVDEHNAVVKDAYIPKPAPVQPLAPPRYVVGGQAFTNQQQADDAYAILRAQMDAGGGGLLEALQPGGTFEPGIEEQLAANHPAADAAAGAATSSSMDASSASAADVSPAPSTSLVIPFSDDSASDVPPSNAIAPIGGGIPWGLILSGAAALGAVVVIARPSSRGRQPRRRR